MEVISCLGGGLRSLSAFSSLTCLHNGPLIKANLHSYRNNTVTGLFDKAAQDLLYKIQLHEHWLSSILPEEKIPVQLFAHGDTRASQLCFVGFQIFLYKSLSF